jgi:hypothetical protein
MQPGDIVFGQLVTAEGITILEASSLCFIPPMYKIELIDFRKKLLRGKPRFTAANLCDWDLEFIERYLDIMDKVLNPYFYRLRGLEFWLFTLYDKNELSDLAKKDRAALESLLKIELKMRTQV